MPRVLSERAQLLVARLGLLERHGMPGRPENLPGMPSLTRGPPQQDDA